jgi:bifunctional DNase/RNase
MYLQCIAFLDGHASTLIILRNDEGTHLFLLPGDYYTAAAISQSLDKSERPGTHQAMAMLLDACEGSIIRIVVDYCDNAGVYHTAVTVNTDTARRVLDLRPSDALSLSHACRVPFLVRESLLQKVDDHLMLSVR